MKRQSLLIVAPAMVLSVVVSHAQAEKQTPAPTLERAQPRVSAGQAGAAALIDQAGAVAVKRKAANSKQNSSLATSTGAAAGPSAARSTAPPGAASAARLSEVQQPRGNSRR